MVSETVELTEADARKAGWTPQMIAVLSSVFRPCETRTCTRCGLVQAVWEEPRQEAGR